MKLNFPKQIGSNKSGGRAAVFYEISYESIGF